MAGRPTKGLCQLFFVIFFCSLYQGDPQKLPTIPKDVHVVVNTKAKFTYLTSILRPTTVEFVKINNHGNVSTIADQPGGRIYYEIKTEDGGKTLRATLHFNPVTIEDIGQYQCRLYIKRHQMITSHSFLVKVIKRLPIPRVRIAESNPYLDATITLICSLPFRLQAPSFLWVKDRVVVVPDARHKMVSDYMTIRKLDSTDEGSYYCIVRNGNLVASSQLKYVTIKPEIAIVPMALTKIEGESANFSCQVISGGTSSMKLLLVKPGPEPTKIGENEKVFNNLSISSGESSQTINYQCLLVLNDLKNPVSRSPIAQLTIVKSNFQNCPQQLSSNVTWSSTAAGMVDIKRCPGNSIGQATRRCIEGPTWSDPNLGNCTSIEFKDLLLQAEAIKLGDYTPFYNASGLLQVLENATKTNPTNKEGLTGGDIDITVEILSNLVNYSQANNNINSEEDQQNFLQICSNILEPINTQRWIQCEDQIEKGTKALWNRLIVIVDHYGLHLTNQMTGSAHKLIEKANIVMKLDRVSKQNKQVKKIGLQFLYKEFESSLFLPPEVFSHDTDYQVVSLVYKTLNDIMRLKNDINVTQVNKEDGILLSNTTVVTSVVRPPPIGKFKEKVKIVVKNKMDLEPVLQRTCVFWREGLPNAWGKDGCNLVASESDKHVTTCECDHLTVFAAIMDPYGGPIPEEHRKALELISTIGCAVSLIGVLLTLFVMMYFWKTLKTPRTIILINICVAIAMVCVLVIAEGTARDTKAGCTLMAILLHYFLLAVFCWMLCEGLFLYFVIIKIAGVQMEERVTSFLLFGWGFPLIIVGISLAATRAQGYGYHGNQTACWLAVENGLIWACIAPAIVVLLINIVIYIMVLRRMMSTRHVQNKSRDEKLRMGVRATAVILPVLGITWLFGLLAFNSETLAFKYFFAIFNSLQGLMIFIFHCLLNQQAQLAFKRKFSHFSSTADSTGFTQEKGKNVSNQSTRT